MSALNYAIKLERDGEHFYQEQAVHHADTPLQTAFEELARAQGKKVKVFEEFAANQGIALEAAHDLETLYKNPPAFGDEMTRMKDQSEVYLYAQQLEQLGIDEFQKRFGDASEEREAVDLVLAEKRRHFGVLANLAEMTSRPEEWIEYGEFGNRPQY